MSQVFTWSSVSSENRDDEIKAFANRYRLKTRVDEDNTTIIPGGMGHIYDFGEGRFGVMVIPGAARRHKWGFVRASLLRQGFVVIQDGDGEGAAIFDPRSP
jgi:hypothetical protein